MRDWSWLIWTMWNLGWEGLDLPDQKTLEEIHDQVVMTLSIVLDIENIGNVEMETIVRFVP